MRMNGKKLLLTGICLGVSFIGVLFLLYGYENTWRLWGIPAMQPYFADLRTITGGAESWAWGYDPLINNPGDPWGRLMNYPRVWQLLFKTGIDHTDTIYFGIVFSLLFFIGIIISTSAEIDRFSAILMIISIFSPAVLLGLERGNNDLVIFFLLSVTIALSNVASIYSKLIALASAMFAFILKLFPIFAFVFLVKDKRMFLKAGSVVMVLAVIYFLLTYDDLLQIRQATPKRIDILSYGKDVFWMRVNKFTPEYLSVAKAMMYLSLCVALFFFFVGLLTKTPKPISDANNSSQNVDAFRIGSAIYIGTFLLGNNMEYRLLFLLFTIPHLTFLGRSSVRCISWTARIVIVGILISMWYLSLRRAQPFIIVNSGIPFSFLLDEVVKWLVFMGLSYLIACSAPVWIMNGFANMISFNSNKTIENRIN